MKFSELIEMNIFTPATTLKIHNFKLTDNSLIFSTGYYDISLIDKNKNIDGLWLDNMINTERILEVLKDFNIKSALLSKIPELELNKLLENHFKNYFENIKKGGTSDKGLIDLIVGDLVYGIELKLARELTLVHIRSQFIMTSKAEAKYMQFLLFILDIILVGKHLINKAQAITPPTKTTSRHGQLDTFNNKLSL